MLIKLTIAPQDRLLNFYNPSLNRRMPTYIININFSTSSVLQQATRWTSNLWLSSDSHFTALCKIDAGEAACKHVRAIKMSIAEFDRGPILDLTITPIVV